MITNDFFKKLSDTHPFMSVVSYANQEYVGIIQNRDDVVTTLYDYGAIIDKDATSPISFTEENQLESGTYNAFHPLGQRLFRKIYREYAIRNPQWVSTETYHAISTIIFSIKILDELDYDIREYVEYYYNDN